jgi:hypothetical protein
MIGRAIRRSAAALALLGPGGTPALAQDAVEFPVPSGLRVTLIEVIHEPQLSRWRFLVPEIVQAGGFDAVAGDFGVLCAEVALPMLAEQGREADRIIVSLSDRPVPFGAIDPAATQYFEAYRVENDACIWDGF